MTHEIANTILSQLGGARRVAAMIGVKSFVASEDGVSFRFPQSARSKPNHVGIKLAGDDTYTVTFTRISGVDFKTTRIAAGVFCENLAETIEQEIGLYLSLSPAHRPTFG